MWFSQQTNVFLDKNMGINFRSLLKFKVKGHPITGQDSPKGKYRYTSTLSLTLALDVVGG